jgi:hypothetical protein
VSEQAEQVDQEEASTKEPMRIVVVGAGPLLGHMIANRLAMLGAGVVLAQSGEKFGGVEPEKILLDDIAIHLPVVPEAYVRPAKRDRSKKNEPWYRGFDKRTGRYR